MTPDPHRPTSLLFTALVAGLVAGVVEMLPVLPIQAMLGASPGRVFKAIAAGLLGKAAFTGGAGTVLLGIGLHLLISVAAALVFVLVYVRLPSRWRRPVVCGLAFGVIAFVVMVYGVVPLSATPFKARPPLPRALLSLAIHMAGFGVPIALVTARMYPSRRQGADLAAIGPR